MVEQLNFNNSYKQIDPEDILDYEKYKSTIDLIICGKCKNIPIEPNECNQCQITYCNNCLEHNNQSSLQLDKLQVKKCPRGCLKSYISDNIKVLKLLKVIKFKCKFGCKSAIWYNNYLQHMSHL